jgi:BolA family transcriptional regulator, general stress-responsive regulator
MTAKERIEVALRRAFDPLHMEVVDESAKHAGHAHARPGGETHFQVRVVADAFRGKSRLERHRLVNGALADEFSHGLHALAIDAAAPDET